MRNRFCGPWSAPPPSSPSTDGGHGDGARSSSPGAGRGVCDVSMSSLRPCNGSFEVGAEDWPSQQLRSPQASASPSSPPRTADSAYKQRASTFLSPRTSRVGSPGFHQDSPRRSVSPRTTGRNTPPPLPLPREKSAPVRSPTPAPEARQVQHALPRNGIVVHQPELQLQDRRRGQPAHSVHSSRSDILPRRSESPQQRAAHAAGCSPRNCDSQTLSMLWSARDCLSTERSRRAAAGKDVGKTSTPPRSLSAQSRVAPAAARSWQSSPCLKSPPFGSSPGTVQKKAGRHPCWAFPPSGFASGSESLPASRVWQEPIHVDAMDGTIAMYGPDGAIHLESSMPSTSAWVRAGCSGNLLASTPSKQDSQPSPSPRLPSPTLAASFNTPPCKAVSSQSAGQSTVAACKAHGQPVARKLLESEDYGSPRLAVTPPRFKRTWTPRGGHLQSSFEDAARGSELAACKAAAASETPGSAVPLASFRDSDSSWASECVLSVSDSTNLATFACGDDRMSEPALDRRQDAVDSRSATGRQQPEVSEAANGKRTQRAAHNQLAAFREALQRAPGFDSQLREDLLGVLSDMQGDRAAEYPAVGLHAGAQASRAAPPGENRWIPAQSHSSNCQESSAWDVDLEGADAGSSPTQSDIEDALESMPDPDKYSQTAPVASASWGIPTPLRSMARVHQPDAPPPGSALPRGGCKAAVGLTPPCKKWDARAAAADSAALTPSALSQASRRGSLASARNRFKRSIGASSRSCEFRTSILRELDTLQMSPIQCKDHTHPVC
eukprot:TRINITY_DN14642_c0_g1_i1.p1 TRINITY_DN14642_c0_g1~~TRINITY_DN14642_c0_g1_i1.p1  ORF type:complete len:779 (+),score=88.66 TRINITY_DN14642_c0_g1_i1:78-2414(+)